MLLFVNISNILKFLKRLSDQKKKLPRIVALPYTFHMGSLGLVRQSSTCFQCLLLHQVCSHLWEAPVCTCKQRGVKMLNNPLMLLFKQYDLGSQRYPIIFLSLAGVKEHSPYKASIHQARLNVPITVSQKCHQQRLSLVLPVFTTLQNCLDTFL